jgi:hypothetical protein
LKIPLDLDLFNKATATVWTIYILGPKYEIEYYMWLVMVISGLSLTAVKQRYLISRRQDEMAFWKSLVDVSGHENLDSMPNLIISGAARSVFYSAFTAQNRSTKHSQLIP